MGYKESLKKFKIRNILEVLIISIVLIVSVSSGIMILTTDTEDAVHFIVGNETYTVDETMDFNSITIDYSHIIFNSTGFYVSSGNDITIQLVYINDDITGAGDQEKVIEFFADTSGGNVLFDLSGFPVGNDYVIKRDGNSFSYPTTNSSGFISFSNNVWSSHNFEIFQDGEGTGDTTSPVISNVNVVHSSPIDTQNGFGWENFICTVTDNVEVDGVFINITCSGGTTTNVSMVKIGDTNQYHYNTILSQHGNYTYFIWANDTSSNADISSDSDLSIPPNWDINNDGVCDTYDKILISSHYGETSVPGWIREDIDNNGQIQVLDIVLSSLHYGETWWV